MQLLGIKICVMIALLFATFMAACLPLLIMLRYISEGGNHKHQRSTKFLQRMPGIIKSCLPRFLCCGKPKEDLPYSDEDDASSNSESETKSPKNSKFPSLMNCFSGGVFLGTSFIALMPEIREIFDGLGIMWPKFNSNTPNSTEVGIGDEMEGTPMPITEMLVTCGLFLILCIEQGVHSLMDRDKRHNKKKPGHPDIEKSEDVSMNGINGSKAIIKVTLPTPTNDEIEAKVMIKDDVKVDGLSHAIENNSLLNDEPKETHDIVHREDSIVRSVILVAILSIHSLLEGLAIGLQTKASSTLSIFFAVVFHKSLMAFSLGNSLVQSGHSTKRILIGAAIFACTSPTGIATGIIMKETKSGTEIVNGILQGIATGTFLFITFFEVLSKEFSCHLYRISKTIAFILGYCCILAVMFTQHGA